MLNNSQTKTIGKVIAIIVATLFGVIVLLVVAFIIIWNHDDSKEYHYTTEYGDTFTVSVDGYLGKASLSCSGYRFGCGIQYYNEGDQIMSLCDTLNITCYEIDGLTICKLKQSNQMVLLSWLAYDSYKEQRDELQRILQLDEEARKYIELPEIKNSPK